jgi:2-oxoglutarate dehydrogenase E2 component (dihydrolipoamide succinyltransferase)
MGKEVKILLPKLGESIVSGTIVQILKKEHDLVLKDEPLLEVSTDKVNTEIPSTVSGTIKKVLVHVSQEVYVGDPLMIIDIDEQEKESLKEAPKEKSLIKEDNLKNLFSPAVLQLAKKHNLSMHDLQNIPVSQKGGRLSKKDIEAYLEETSKEKKLETQMHLPLLRKAIAQNLTKSFYEAPHASVFTEINVGNLLAFIEKNKEAFFEKHGFKLTITPFLAKALCKALQAYPLLNSTLHDDMLTIKHYINLGIAVNTNEGVMVVVIKDAEKKSTHALAEQIKVFAEKAKDHTLDLTDTQKGTITLTNFGMTGVLMGNPIIRYPEAAIIGAGSITKRWIVEEGNDQPVMAPIMMMSVTFDHRIFDGVYACSFLQELKKQIEENISL